MNRLYLTMLIASFVGVGSNTEAHAAGLDEGGRLPAFQFDDIHGRIVDTSQYSDWIQVYCFADRNSSSELLDWMSEAGIEAMTQYPDERFAYLGFADVTMVPDVFRHLAVTATTQMEQVATAELEASFAERGLVLDPNQTAFHLVADWDGVWLETFQIENAEVFRCWTVYQGHVVSSYQGNMPDLTQRYLLDVVRILEL